ncbi:BEN domain-containing protein 2 [Bubalus kerabau]|uniref:BEN domain-containing protein 2 n=1 Tax=Bubalus carabanensis TaxID=3119969 RepID=UPI00244E8E67|nr:BEN domain-containing protein 2 [Bubalus carabanensis]
MSDEDDCIVFSIGEDSNDDDDNDDVGAVVIQDFHTDFTDDSSDEEVLVLLTDSEDDSDSPEELPAFLHEMEDFEALNSQIVSCLAILKGGNPDSEEVESVPLCKKERLSVPEDDHMNHTAEDSFNGYRHNQITRLQRYCQNLQELTEIINSQINHLRELVSEIRRSLETPQMPPCGDDNPSLPAERQENDAETNPGGTSLQSAASPEWQQLERSESPSLPRIVCACSLQANHESGSPATRRFLLSIFSEDDENANSDLSCAQDSLAQPTAHLPQAESSLHDNFETVRDSAINNNMNPDTALPSLCIPPNFETPGEAETSLSSSTEIMHYPTLLENGSGQDIVSSDLIPPNFGTSQEKDTPVMNQPPFLEYDSDEDASYVFIPSDSDSSTEMNSEAENHGSVIEMDSDQQTDSEPCFLTPGFGYVGDPRRNVIMLAIHLMAVQKKAIPRHAACYLVRILFSKEILTSSSVRISSQGCQSLDPNKIAAIREHLAAVFPNYDLSEHGEEWQACISNINSLIRNLCSRRTLKTVQKNGGPTKRKRDSNDERDGDDSASSAQVSQQEAVSETREHGNSPQDSRAFPEGIQEPSTDGAAVSSETLEYLGDPRRNIQMPKSLLMTAKEKSRPDLSARYLILSLFTEEVLINSVRGSLEFGVYSLNANKINALREFLQDIYPTCDLSENGYDWKLCVMAINSCIYSLKCDLEWPTVETQSLPPTTPSSESKPKDTDLAD